MVYLDKIPDRDGSRRMSLVEGIVMGTLSAGSAPPVRRRETEKRVLWISIGIRRDDESKYHASAKYISVLAIRR